MCHNVGKPRCPGKRTGHQEVLSELMRAAHSLKGAARIMDLNALVGLTHAMEDVFVAAQKEKIAVDAGDIDILLKGVDKLGEVAKLSDDALAGWLAEQQPELDQLMESYAAIASGTAKKKPAPRKETKSEEPVEEQGEIYQRMQNRKRRFLTRSRERPREKSPGKNIRPI